MMWLPQLQRVESRLDGPVQTWASTHLEAARDVIIRASNLREVTLAP